MKNTFKKLLLTSSIIVLMHSTYSFANNSANADGVINSVNEKSKEAENAFNQGKDAKSSKEALKMFDLAIQINPDYCKAYIAKISAYYRLSDYKNVLKTFEEASSCNSCKTTDSNNYIESALFMGEVLYTIEKYKDAIKLYNIALKVKPNDNDIQGTKYADRERCLMRKKHQG